MFGVLLIVSIIGIILWYPYVRGKNKTESGKSTFKGNNYKGSWNSIRNSQQKDWIRYKKENGF